MIDIKKLKHIHFTGIKGVGMTSLALCCDDLGIKVTGSDVSEEFVTDEILKKRRITWRVGFGKKNLKVLPDLVITTGAHGGLRNPEVVFAKEKQIPVMTHAEALANIAKDKKTIAVCGVGGKTSISSMISVLLDTAGRCPTFAIGVGDIPHLNTPGRFDTEGKEFVCEADEYVVSPGIDNTPRFMLLTPKVVVVTNVEHDHPDVYPTFEDTKKTFLEFFEKIPRGGLLIACFDNTKTMEVVKKVVVPVKTYGFGEGADFRVSKVSFREGNTIFWLNKKRITLKVPGRFNVLNATATFAVGKYLGIQEDVIVKGIEKYVGCKRRFEKIGNYRGGLIFDDYAHHPTELKATLRAAREWFPKKKIIAIFQPHTYSRTKILLNDFAKSFGDADLVAIMDIYASAREKDTMGVTSKILVRKIRQFHKRVYYTGSFENTLRWIRKVTKKGDIILTMGAGNIFHIHKKIELS